MDPWDFFSNLFATLIGVLIGIPVALWVDRLTSSSHQRAQAKRILTAISDELTHNLGLLKQMRNELQKNVIFYNLDLSAWLATTSRGLESLRNYDLVRQVSSLYYEFQHLSRKVDVQFQMHYSTLLTSPNYNEIRSSLVGPIVAHAAQLEKTTSEVMLIVKKELEDLNKDP